MTSDTMTDATGTPWHPYGDDAYHKRMAETDFPGRHLLHLTETQWSFLDGLRLNAPDIELRGVGSVCVHTPAVVGGDLSGDIAARPSPIMGGTFLLFSEQ